MTGNALRFSAALLSVSCFASLARAQEQGLDPTWTDTSGLSDDEDATPAQQSSSAPSGAPPVPSGVPPLVPPTPPGARLVLRDWRERVWLTGDDPRLKFEIYSLAEGANKKVPIFVCRNPCRVMLRRGEYRVRVSGGPEQVEGDRKIEVLTSAHFYFSLPDRSAKRNGLVVAITGSALFSTGVMVYLLSLLGEVDCSDNREDCYERAQVGVYVGQAMMAGGVVLMPVGWIWFARNRKPRLEQRALVAARREGRQLGVGIGAFPISGGGVFGFSGNF
jgi:hypothetical protein